jgi:HTH-type transcriptional regulator/antitoxin MqsA
MAQADTRLCSSCGAPGMIYGHRNITRNFEGSTITVPDVEGWFCSACGEIEFDSSESARNFLECVTNLQQQERLKQASELRAIRKRLKLTQRQAAELFGGGANAFSDYERGTTKPARSTVLLLHLLDHHPELVQELQQHK